MDFKHAKKNGVKMDFNNQFGGIVTSDMFWSTVFEFRSSSRAAPAQYYFIGCILTIQRCHLFLKNYKFLKNQQSPWPKKFN